MAAFGWSVGDLVSALSVAAKVHKALKDAGGAADSYRESVSFLDSLSITLRMLVGFYEANLCKDDLTDVQSQIELIKNPIDAFTKRVKDKFESSLGNHKEKGFRAKFKGISRKVEWALWTDAECKKLSTKISTPLVAVQMSISMYTIAVVSAVPGHISSNIERIINSAIPTLIEHSMLPLKDVAYENSSNQIAHSTAIEQKLTSLPEVIARRIEPAFEAIREGETRDCQKTDENCHVLMDRIEKLESRLIEEIGAAPLHLSEATSSDRNLLHGSLGDGYNISPRLVNIVPTQIQQTTLSGIPRYNKQSQSVHKLLDNGNSILKNCPSMNMVDPPNEISFPMNTEFEPPRTALGLSHLTQFNHSKGATMQDPQSAWTEAHTHFQLFIKLLLRGFYDLFTQLWPLFTSLFFQLRVMQKCIIRFPSILSKDDITFIDALGRSRKLPYTVYGNWETFNRFLRTHYEKIPGETHLLQNRYRITRKDGNIISDYQWESEAVPNATIYMAVSLNIGVSGSRCPKCHSHIASNERHPAIQKSHFFVCPNSNCALEFFFHHPSGRAQQPRFPVWLEVAGSIKRVEYTNMRKKVNTLSLTNSPSNHPYYTSDGSEPYRHLLRAETTKRDRKNSDFRQDYNKILASRKKENDDLEHYFKRVYVYSNPWDPCKICGFEDYKYEDDLDRHMLTQHSRIYACIFDFAGCQEAFADKEQWKCHINSQHLNWVCDIQECPNETIYPLNHYHREIYVFDKRQKAARLQTMRNRTMEVLRVSLRERKEPPLKMGCSLGGCNEIIEGLDCWARMIEHVAKHVKEDAVCIAEWYCGKLKIDHHRDELFLNWALTSGIVKRDGKGYRFKDVG